MTVYASARLDGDVENTIMARELAVRYELATGPGSTVADKLEALVLLGWRVLVDRRWVGSKRTTIDALLVGPGGVVVIDVRDWHDVRVDRGSIYCGHECYDDETALLRSVTDRVQETLRDHGVTRQALRSVWVYAGKRVDAYAQQVHLVGEADLATWVSSLTRRLEDNEIDTIAAVLERDFVPHAASSPLATRAAEARERGRGLGPSVAMDLDGLTTAITLSAMASPVERWMTFLAPDQLGSVTTSWDGPVLVTGPAGSGKTVVGLHRAAYLAQRNAAPVLFVAPTAALPAVVRSLASRLAPNDTGITVTSLVDLATGLVEQAGTRPHLDARQLSIAFMSAWMSVGRGGPLSQVDERASYWQEEIDQMVKGRGITELTDYLASPRTGRRVALDQSAREAVWRLYVEYQRRLEKTRQHDVNDVLVQARDLVRSGAVTTGWSAVVVDNAEDVSVVGLQLLHALAGDGPDRLFVLGDGRQSVVSGGGALADAGIDVAGRVVELRSNRRSSADLLALAGEAVLGDSYVDLDGGVRPHVAGLALRRRGPAPEVVRLADPAALCAAMVDRLVAIAELPGVGWGDVAVLVHDAADLATLRSVLMRAALPVVDLVDFDGATDRVVVGTVDQAKGLGFDHVLMPGLVTESPAQPGENEDAHGERIERRRREEYVAMTRARHGLWLGYVDPA